MNEWEEQAAGYWSGRRAPPPSRRILIESQCVMGATTGLGNAARNHGSERVTVPQRRGITESAAAAVHPATSIDLVPGMRGSRRPLLSIPGQVVGRHEGGDVRGRSARLGESFGDLVVGQRPHLIGLMVRVGPSAVSTDAPGDLVGAAL